VTLGDGVSTKSLMKMVYRKLPKTASLPVTCHPASAFCRSDESRLLKGGTVSRAPKNHNKTVAMFKQHPRGDQSAREILTQEKVFL
jgi:hypothetical protein